MQTKLISFAIIAAMAFAACGAPAQNSGPTLSSIEAEKSGPWKLSRDASGLSFTTIKKGNFAEVNTFRAMDGKVTEGGAAEFIIVLDSVFTNNDVRDPRMREFLFETAQHPHAKVTTALALSEYADMEIGARQSSLLDFTLDIHGVSVEQQAWVTVTRLGVNKVAVDNKAPLIINAADHNMLAGVEKLRELANLPEITPIVPVTFSLVFER